MPRKVKSATPSLAADPPQPEEAFPIAHCLNELPDLEEPPYFCPYMASFLPMLNVDYLVNKGVMPRLDGLLSTSVLRREFHPRALEFAGVCPQLLVATFACVKNPINEAFNNDRRVLPYDHNRVVLPASQANPQGYQNASLLSLPAPPLDYILTQNPQVMANFWEMVWAERVGLIVCLDAGVDYLPHESSPTVPSSQVGVTLVSQYECKCCLVRQLSLNFDGGSRTVWHLLHGHWALNGTPRSSDLYIDFLDEIDTLRPACSRQNLSRVLVHCPNGAGRSGLHVLLEYCKGCVDNSMEVDLPGMLHFIRAQRMMAVTSLAQYLFALHFVESYNLKSLFV